MKRYMNYLLKYFKALLERTLFTILIIFCAQSCPTLWLYELYSLPGSSVHGIAQVRIPECVSIFSTSGYLTTSDFITFLKFDSLIECKAYLYNKYIGVFPSVNKIVQHAHGYYCISTALLTCICSFDLEYFWELLNKTCIYSCQFL